MRLFQQKILIPLALSLSLIATFVVYSYLNQKKETTQQDKIEPQSAVIAVIVIQPGTTIGPEHIQVVNWPKNLLPIGTFGDAANVLGRVAKTMVVTGELLLEGKLAPLGSTGGFSSLIPVGMRALSVAVDVVSGVSGFILPNAHVDVLVTVPSAMEKEVSSTKMILENVQVLAVDQTFDRTGDAPVAVQSATLLVTPEQAEKLALGATEGKLLLSLRNSADGDMMPTQGVLLRQLIAGGGIIKTASASETGGNKSSLADAPRPKAPAQVQRPSTYQAENIPPSHTVEILCANKRAQVSFADKQ